MRSQIDRLAEKFVDEVLAAIGKIPLGELAAVLAGESPNMAGVPIYTSPSAEFEAAVSSGTVSPTIAREVGHVPIGPKKRGLASKSPAERSIIARKAAATRRRNLAAAAAAPKKGGRS